MNSLDALKKYQHEMKPIKSLPIGVPITTGRHNSFTNNHLIIMFAIGVCLVIIVTNR